jgi:hypothetical protein
MKTFLTSLSIWTGGIISILTIVDWLLTAEQQKKIKRWGDHLWLWLEYQSAKRFIRQMRRTRIQMLLTAVVYGALLSLWYYFAPSQGRRGTASPWVYPAFLLLCFPLTLWRIHPHFVKACVRNIKTLGDLSFLTFWSLFGLFGAIGGVVFIENVFVTTYFERVSILQPHLTSAEVISGAGHFVALLFFGIACVEAGLLSTMLVISVLWLSFALLLIVLFRMTQFFLIRIVEHSRGPVLGISGLLVAVGALLKIFL